MRSPIRQAECSAWSRAVAPGERGPFLAHFAQPGTWLGEAAAFTERPRQIGLSVTRDTQVLHLPLPAIREIVGADPAAWRFFGFAAIAHNSVAIGAADDLLIRHHVKRSACDCDSCDTSAVPTVALSLSQRVTLSVSLEGC
jgi:CRP-like cAMP-binding protein